MGEVALNQSIVEVALKEQATIVNHKRFQRVNELSDAILRSAMASYANACTFQQARLLMDTSVAKDGSAGFLLTEQRLYSSYFATAGKYVDLAWLTQVCFAKGSTTELCLTYPNGKVVQVNAAQYAPYIAQVLCEIIPVVQPSISYRQRKLNAAAAVAHKGASFYFMPLEQVKERSLAGALSSYASGCPKEKVLLLMDTTVFGGGKEGFLLAEDRLYASFFNTKDKSVSLPGCITAEVDPKNKSYVLLEHVVNGVTRLFCSIYAEYIANALTDFLRVQLSERLEQASAELARSEQLKKEQAKKLARGEQEAQARAQRMAEAKAQAEREAQEKAARAEAARSEQMKKEQAKKLAQGEHEAREHAKRVAEAKAQAEREAREKAAQAETRTTQGAPEFHRPTLEEAIARQQLLSQLDGMAQRTPVGAQTPAPEAPVEEPKPAPEVQPEPTPEPVPEVKPEPVPEPEAKPEPAPEVKPEPEPDARQILAQGMEEYQKGLYGAAHNHFQMAQNLGDLTARFNLGVMSDRGRGVSRNLSVARRWYQAAADNGAAEAQYNLGQLYYQGEGGVKQDRAAAFEWFLKAAQQGLAEAQAMVGAIYLDGVLTERDQKEGRRWLQRAANQGLTAAQELLEHC
jgi:hypothetical protein